MSYSLIIPLPSPLMANLRRTPSTVKKPISKQVMPDPTDPLYQLVGGVVNVINGGAIAFGFADEVAVEIILVALGAAQGIGGGDEAIQGACS